MENIGGALRHSVFGVGIIPQMNSRDTISIVSVGTAFSRQII